MVSFRICSTCEKTFQVPELANKRAACGDKAPSDPSEDFKDLDGCQDVDEEDVEQWLAVDEDLQQDALSDEDIIGTVTYVVQDDDDGDDIVENTTSLISHTDGMKALEEV
ncbi:hypothetical protein AVEN_167731-1 [Araneus ventricosus]|uniref:Uncharacterized protein n=1 Tax=Araneus ventricosus TaxID=182803 RepID=A0A4Y2I338_ARAVE|nr:hypothetical protein AVEN_167731-1 [Araneus ventricosus]